MTLVSSVSAGQTATSTWANAIRDATIQVTTASARPSSPAEGMVIYETDTDRVLVYSGSAWVRIGASTTTGRTGVKLSRAANQSISTGTNTSISWDTETSDPDGFITATSATITVPSGLGGIYLVSAAITYAANPAAVGTFTQATAYFTVGGAVQVDAANYPYGYVYNSGGSYFTGVTSIKPMAAGDTVEISVIQTSGGSVNATAKLDMYLIGT